MDINHNAGANGKRHGPTETISGAIDMKALNEDNLVRDVLRYVAKKLDRAGKSTPEEMESHATRGESMRNHAYHRKAFRSLHKKETVDSPKGTVGPTVPMEIRVKQLSLFPGIY